MKRLIVNADDFGYCEAVNYGIVHAHRAGIVSSATVMVNMPGAAHARALLDACPDLGVGVHLTLTCGKPLSAARTLVDDSGSFSRERLSAGAPGTAPDALLSDVLAEWSAQIDKALAMGFPVDHLDSHHHTHTWPRLRPALRALLDQYDFPLRGSFADADDLAEYPRKSTLITTFYDAGATLENLTTLLEAVRQGQVCDLMCHPAYLDAFLYEGSSYTLPRLREGALLCMPQVRTLLAQNGLTLSTYACL